MILTKNLEAELRQLYVQFFNSMFNADVETYKSFMADEINQIGTTLEEVYYNKIESGNYLERAVGPVAGKIEFRNRDIRMKAVDGLISIIEQADCYINIDGAWAFYDNARVSSLLQKKTGEWKFVQQHISFPDSRTEEGQTVGLEKIKAENIQLRDAVKRRTKELENANRELENTLSKLKATQAQLIHSEKMASLGELTAGIAHEIQNPLNFVNNFSDVSAEMIEEIEGEIKKNKEERNELLMAEILRDIKENLLKINHHGKRADSIVKGMLDHSRTNGGERVLTNINSLADEYLRLSFHGMRAKNSNFQANFETHFDPNLPKVNVIPQNIGRVFLNIINNAFQAIDNTDTGKKDPDFKPIVKVATRDLGDKIEITIADNGPGIPEEIKDKIFQPFFTTKPTGEGTGLGLSLSYDIIKAHGGDLEVESKLNEGSVFKITLSK
jgi:signal transduction histidine kinase